MVYKRILNPFVLVKRKSFFLLGPRSTGKTTLLHKKLPSVKVYDLLDPETSKRLHIRPQILKEENNQGDPKPTATLRFCLFFKISISVVARVGFRSPRLLLPLKKANGLWKISTLPLFHTYSTHVLWNNI